MTNIKLKYNLTELHKPVEQRGSYLTVSATDENGKTVEIVSNRDGWGEFKRAREIFEYIAPKYGIAVEEWNHDVDHVHVLFRAQPKTELSKFINAYKSASSRLLKQEFPGIRCKLWKEYFWSRSFCLLTTGGAPVEVIRKYIENQGEKSRT